MKTPDSRRRSHLAAAAALAGVPVWLGFVILYAGGIFIGAMLLMARDRIGRKAKRILPSFLRAAGAAAI